MDNNVSTTIMSNTFGISKDIIILISKMGFIESMKIINYVLTTIKDNIAAFAPSDTDINNSKQQAQQLLYVINMIAESPEFKQKWADFSQKISQLMKILLQKISQATSEEFDEILDKFVQLAQKNIMNSIKGAGAGALRGVCAIPPVVPFCMMASVASTTSKVGGDTLITMLNTVAKLSEALSRIVDDSVNPFVETIQQAKDMFNYIQNIQNTINSKVEGVQNLVSSNIEKAQQLTNNPTNL